MLLMLPYMLILAISGNELKLKDYVFIPKKENRANWVMENNYDNMRKKYPIELASIDKLFYEENESIKLFLRINDNEKTNHLIETLCPDLRSYDRQDFTFRPFNALKFNFSDDYFKNTSAEEHKIKVENSLACLSKVYDVSIDTGESESFDYVFYEHPNSKEKGLLTGINIDQLETGKHKLIIKKKGVNQDTVRVEEVLEIPFFKN